MKAPSRSKKSSLVRKTPFQPSDLYKIRSAVTSSGEHRPLLTSAISGLPVLRVNQYMLVSRRDRCQVNTMKSELRALSILLSWADTQGIDLNAEVDRGIGLDQAQIVSLVDALKLDYQKKKSDGDEGGSKVVALQIAVVTAEVWASRIAVARDFIIWGLSNVLARCEPGSLRYEHVRERRADIATEINSRIPPTHGSGKRYGLTPKLKQRLFDVTRPGAIENPFQPAWQPRNALMIDLLEAIGVRRGELLKLRTTSFSPGPKPTINILRKPDDLDDPRANQPQVKTQERRLPLDVALAARLQIYITEERRLLPNAKKTPFLFLSRSGKPMSLKNFNKMFDQISKWHPEFIGLLSPHILRHTFNDDFSETLERSGCSQEKAKEQRNYVNGWTPNSSQGTRYNRRFVEKKSQETLLEHQRRLFCRDEN